MQINLLSPQTIVKREAGLEKSTKNIALVGGGLSLLLLLVAGILVLVQLGVKSEMQTAQAELDKLQPVAQQMAEHNKLQRDLIAKENVFNTLYKSRPLWTPHINEIKELLPGNMSLTALVFDNEKGEWEIEGIAPAHDQVAQFCTGLQGSSYFGKGLVTYSAISTELPGIEFTIQAVTSGGGQK